MKIEIETRLIVLGGTSRDYKTKDGASGTSYTFAVLQDGQCTNVSVTEDVFKSVIYDPTKYVTLGGTYDDKYGRFVLDKVFSGDSSATPATSATPAASGAGTKK